MIPVNAGTYTITQTDPSGWALIDGKLYDPTNNSSFNVANKQATINVAAGEVVHVEFISVLIQSTKMSNSCSSRYIEDFGSGALGTYGDKLTGETSFHFSNIRETAEDGTYKILGQASYFHDFIPNSFDHTSGNGTGRMMLVNAGYAQEEFFRRRFTNIKPNDLYSFSTWVKNINTTSPIKPNISLKIVRTDNGDIIAQYDTGDITSGDWTRYGSTFSTPDQTEIYFVIVNNTIGGDGNDLAIDDIEFALSPAPPLKYTVNYNACNTASISIVNPSATNIEYSINGGAYQTSTTFSNLSLGTYTIRSRWMDTTGCDMIDTVTVHPSICGSLLNDVNGLTDNLLNGSAYNGTTPLHINVLNSAGQVIGTALVQSDGTYTLNGIPNGNYTLQLSTNQGTIGQPAPAKALPAGWANTAEQLNTSSTPATGDGLMSITLNNANVSGNAFGIQQLPTATSNTLSTQTNPGGTNSLLIPASSFGGTDPSGGTITAIVITSFPTNATSVTIDGVIFTTLAAIQTAYPNGIPTNTAGQPNVSISVDPSGIDAVTVTIPYKVVDNAGMESLNTADLIIPFGSAYCYRPAVTTPSGSILATKVGISSLGRAGADDPDNWPMVRKGGWIALESKTKGFVPNRVAFADGNPVGIPVANFVEGMAVYDTTNHCLKVYTLKEGDTNMAWHCITTPACPD